MGRRAFLKMDRNHHRRVTHLACVTILGIFTACAENPVITPGAPRAVVQSVAVAYEAAGHRCRLKEELAYCDVRSGQLPLVIGYNARTQAIVFGTVFDTEAKLGRACAIVLADQVAHPEWM